jgi:AcrR family transcriptional regulator
VCFTLFVDLNNETAMLEHNGMKGKTAVKEAAPRKATREQRRAQFIEATIAVLARNGYGRTTLTDVAAEAGLSHGLIIFHFETKQALLSETLIFLAREYRDNWAMAMANAPDRPAAKLEAIIRADFDEAICNTNRLGAWSSLWGEIQGRPLYQEFGVTYDLEFATAIETLCAALVAEGGYDLDAKTVGRSIRMTLQGLWSDLTLSEEFHTEGLAIACMLTLATAFFPKHFTSAGEIAA